MNAATTLRTSAKMNEIRLYGVASATAYGCRITIGVWV